jgi:hypothetical protein
LSQDPRGPKRRRATRFPRVALSASTSFTSSARETPSEHCASAMESPAGQPPHTARIVAPGQSPGRGVLVMEVQVQHEPSLEMINSSTRTCQSFFRRNAMTQCASRSTRCLQWHPEAELLHAVDRHRRRIASKVGTSPRRR